MYLDVMYHAQLFGPKLLSRRGLMYVRTQAQRGKPWDGRKKIHTMVTYVISGTAKGIGLDGLELTKQWSSPSLPEKDFSHIFPITRSQHPEALEEVIQRSNGRVINLLASITDLRSVQNAADEVKSYLGSIGLDVLVNNAGVAGVTPGGNAADMEAAHRALLREERRRSAPYDGRFLAAVKKGQAEEGHHHVRTPSEAYTPQSVLKMVQFLATGIGRSSGDLRHDTHAHVQDLQGGAAHASKQYSIQYAKEGFTFLCISPGHLRRDLVGGHGDFDVDVGVSEVKRSILGAVTKHKGKFRNIHGPG